MSGNRLLERNFNKCQKQELKKNFRRNETVKKILIAGLIVGLLSSVGYAGNRQQEIFIDEGSFLFKNLSLTPNPNLTNYSELKGDITNNTTKDWRNLKFKIEFYDQPGKKYEDSFYIWSIKKKETKSIANYAQFLRDLPAKNLRGSTYKIYFVNGEYPAHYVFTMVKPKESKTFTFEDNFINIQFPISKSQVGFILKNKTDNPIRIDWNQVSYVDTSTKSHKVTHSGVRYIERNKPQAPTVIPPTAKVEDIITPTDYVYYAEGWNTAPLFPNAPAAKLYKGQTFSIFMPLEINGATKNYLFTFKIEDVKF